MLKQTKDQLVQEMVEGKIIKVIWDGEVVAEIGKAVHWINHSNPKAYMASNLLDEYLTPQWCLEDSLKKIEKAGMQVTFRVEED